MTLATPPSAITACAISERYAELYKSLTRTVKLGYDPAGTQLSEALFHHLAKMKLAGWAHRVEFSRAKKHSIADFFQDLLAFYLRCTLSQEFEVLLEQSAATGVNKKTQADILVRRNGQNYFVIEVKTTIGFARPAKGALDPYEEFSGRIGVIAENFCLPKQNVIYVFEEPSNVTREFLDLYWDRQRARPVPRAALKFPLSHIYPLFAGTDPYYWPWPGKSSKSKQFWYPELNDEQILAEAKKRIITRFESIVELILVGSEQYH